MSIEPDDKNWTWVLERPCDECGFDAQQFDPASAADAILSNAQHWTLLLAHPRVRLRTRPDRWSALEYGCHVRDVFDLYRVRLGLMLSEDRPTYANWDQDETALAKRYDLADPVIVTEQLVEAAARLAAAYRNVDGPDWQRKGYRSDGAAFTVDSFTRYLIHDPVHHLVDVEQGYAAL